MCTAGELKLDTSSGVCVCRAGTNNPDYWIMEHGGTNDYQISWDVDLPAGVHLQAGCTILCKPVCAVLGTSVSA